MVSMEEGGLQPGLELPVKLAVLGQPHLQGFQPLVQLHPGQLGRGPPALPAASLLLLQLPLGGTGRVAGGLLLHHAQATPPGF